MLFPYETHTPGYIYQIYSEACWPAEKMSEENGVSYTDIDQLIRKSVCVEPLVRINNRGGWNLLLYLTVLW